MPQKIPPRSEPIAASTLAAMSRQLLGGRWIEADLAPLADLLDALHTDMTDFHRFEAGELEPALVYEAR